MRREIALYVCVVTVLQIRVCVQGKLQSIAASHIQHSKTTLRTSHTSTRSRRISSISVVGSQVRKRRHTQDEDSPTLGPSPVPSASRTSNAIAALTDTEKYIALSSIFWIPLFVGIAYYYWEKYFRTRTWLVFAAEAKFPALTDRSPVEVILNFRFGNRENGEYRLSFAEDMLVSEVLMAFDGRDHAVDTRVAEVLGQEDFAFSAREVVLYGLAYIPPEDRVEEEGEGDNAASLTATRVSSLPTPFGI